MNACNNPRPTHLPPDDLAKWDEASAIVSKALQDVDALGLGIHTAYHSNFFMCFKDNREMEKKAAVHK